MYYVYIYLDPLRKGKYIFDNLQFDYEPFYVGRGKNSRYLVHLQRSKLNYNSKKNLRIKSIIENNEYPIINLYLTGLTYKDSLNIERDIISKIGRNKFNEGPLTNITTGGQGVSGIKMSEESIIKMKNTCIKRGVYDKLSEKMKGELNTMYGDKWHRTEKGKKSFHEKMSGVSPWKNKSEKEIKNIHDKISETLSGYEWSEENKNKRSVGMKKVWKNKKNKQISKKITIFNIKENKTIEFESMNKASKFLGISNWTLKNRYEKNKIVNNIKIENIE